MINSDVKSLKEEKHRFLSGGGEMGALTRVMDWSITAVGQPETWPQSLRTTIGIVLNSKFPMFLFWGTELTCFYNDAFRPSLGQNGKHPDILGMPAQLAWPEIWDIIKPLIDQVLTGGEATWSEDQLIPIFRNGAIEDVYWTFSYSPVNDESGNIAAVLVTCYETTEKVNTLIELEENRNELELAINAAELGTFDYNPLTNKFSCNTRLKKWFGLAPHENIELQAALNAIEEHDRVNVEAAIQNALNFSSGSSYNIEFSIINPLSKVKIIVHAKGKVWFNEEKIAYRFNGALEDVTEKTLARIKIEESEKEFRQLADTLPALVWTTDNKGTHTFASRRWKEFTGLDPYDITSFEKMTHPEDIGNLLATWSDCLATGKVYQAEVRLKSVNGNYQWFYANGKPILNEKGGIEKWIGTFTNINDQKKTQEELVAAFLQIEESEKRFRDTVQQAPLGITILRGNNFIVEMANDSYLRLVDRPKADFIGKPLFESLPEVKEIVEPLLKRVFITGIPFYAEELSVNLNRYGRKEESSYFNIIYHPLKEENNVISGVMVVATEVTEIVKARHSLAAKEKLSQEILEEAEQRSRLAIEAASMGTFDWNLNTNEFISSQRLNDIFGFINQPHISHTDLINTFHPEDKPGRDEAVKQAGTQGSLSYEARIIWPDNSIHWVRVYGKVLYTGEQPARMYGTAIDITDEKRNIIAVEENTARLNIAIEAAELGAWELNYKTREPYYSERYLQMLGYDAGATPGRDELSEKIHPGDIELLNEAVKKAMETGSLDVEMRLHPNKKTIRWVRARGKVFYDGNGEPEKMLGTLMDITDTKNTLNILQESEERFRNVANSAPVFIWMAGTDKLRNFFNLAWLSFTGRTIEEEKGYGWAVGVHPEDFNRCVNYYIDSFDAKTEFYTEYRLRRHDGEYRWMSARAVPRFSTSGIFEGYIGACMDIHEQVIYQKKLKEDEERLNIIINASELGTWELNLKTKDAQYSERCLQILGYSSRSKVSREKILLQFHPDDLPVRAKAFKRALVTGVLFFEARVKWDDHSIHWIESKGKVFYDDNNQPSHIIGTLRDITEQKYYQQELEDREKKFRLLADSMPELVWTGDVEGNLNYFNQSVYDYTGLTPQQIDKEGWMQIVHPDDREENMRLWLESIHTGKDFLFEHRFKRQGGEYNWQLSRAVPQKDADGNILMWVGTSTNIHQIKEQEQMKDLFISMASHELKTPVTSIKGYVQILQSMYAGSRDKFLTNSLNTVDRQIVTLTKLISELLDLSKIKSGNLVLNQESFDFNELVKDKIDEIKHTNSGKTISFSKKRNPVVFADRDRIGQVLINFLTNAVKYSPDAVEIKVKTEIKDNSAVLSVKDSGIGINKIDQEKIFQRFYRVEGKNEKTYPGFGIGLFIASEIIKRHSGKIGVQSEPGKGSVFYFSIPIYNQL